MRATTSFTPRAYISSGSPKQVVSNSDVALPLNFTVHLRAAQPEDQSFLLQVYSSTRADELALVPWTAEQRQTFVEMQFAAQQTHYASEYPKAAHDIILANEQPVGRIYVARLNEEIRIADITIIPEQRNRGIGTYLIKGLVDEAVLTSKFVSVYVETFNRSLRLFERLGFVTGEQNGINVLLRWSTNEVRKLHRA